jgi:hypothetical protein
MSDFNPENYAEFTTQDGSVHDEEEPAVEDLQPPEMEVDPGRQIVLLPKSLV